jgi:uncharacterized membrane protein YkoI
MKRTLTGLIGLALAAGLAAGSVHAEPSGGPARPVHRPNSLGADWRLQQDEVRQGVRQRQLMPLDRVIAQIGRRTPGRQLDTGLEYQGNRPVYRVRWMTRDGRRVDYLIDATSGAILGGD